MGLEVQEIPKAQLLKEKFFMDIAIKQASYSDDPCTKVGCCFVKDDVVIAEGYNHVICKFNPQLVPTNNDSSNLIEQKNSYMVHAEVSAIINSNKSLDVFSNSTLYVTVSPCHECTKVLIELGIKSIIYLNEYHRTSLWDTSKRMLDTCGVEYSKYKPIFSAQDIGRYIIDTLGSNIFIPADIPDGRWAVKREEVLANRLNWNHINIVNNGSYA